MVHTKEKLHSLEVVLSAMVIPDFDSNGNLPPGDWDATWNELTTRFGSGLRRAEILAGLAVVHERLLAHGVDEIYLDGSFVTNVLRPSDVDVVYVPPGGEDPKHWEDVGPQKRAWIKATWRVDLWEFPNLMPNNAVGVWVDGEPPITIKQFFEFDRDDHPKGLVRLLAREESDTHDQEPETTADSGAEVERLDDDAQ